VINCSKYHDRRHRGVLGSHGRNVAAGMTGVSRLSARMRRRPLPVASTTETGCHHPLMTNRAGGVVKPLLETHLEVTGSRKAAEIHANWPSGVRRLQGCPRSPQRLAALGPQRAGEGWRVLVPFSGDTPQSAFAPHRRVACYG